MRPLDRHGSRGVGAGGPLRLRTVRAAVGGQSPPQPRPRSGPENAGSATVGLRLLISSYIPARVVRSGLFGGSVQKAQGGQKRAREPSKKRTPQRANARGHDQQRERADASNDSVPPRR